MPKASNIMALMQSQEILPVRSLGHVQVKKVSEKHASSSPKIDPKPVTGKDFHFLSQLRNGAVQQYNNSKSLTSGNKNATREICAIPKKSVIQTKKQMKNMPPPPPKSTRNPPQTQLSILRYCYEMGGNSAMQQFKNPYSGHEMRSVKSV